MKESLIVQNPSNLKRFFREAIITFKENLFNQNSSTSMSIENYFEFHRNISLALNQMSLDLLRDDQSEYKKLIEITSNSFSILFQEMITSIQKLFAENKKNTANTKRFIDKSNLQKINSINIDRPKNEKESQQNYDFLKEIEKNPKITNDLSNFQNKRFIEERALKIFKNYKASPLSTEEYLQKQHNPFLLMEFSQLLATQVITDINENNNEFQKIDDIAIINEKCFNYFDSISLAENIRQDIRKFSKQIGKNGQILPADMFLNSIASLEKDLLMKLDFKLKETIFPMFQHELEKIQLNRRGEEKCKCQFLTSEKQNPKFDSLERKDLWDFVFSNKNEQIYEKLLKNEELINSLRGQIGWYEENLFEINKKCVSKELFKEKENDQNLMILNKNEGHVSTSNQRSNINFEDNNLKPNQEIFDTIKIIVNEYSKIIEKIQNKLKLDAVLRDFDSVEVQKYRQKIQSYVENMIESKRNKLLKNRKSIFILNQIGLENTILLNMKNKNLAKLQLIESNIVIAKCSFVILNRLKKNKCEEILDLEDSLNYLQRPPKHFNWKSFGPVSISVVFCKLIQAKTAIDKKNEGKKSKMTISKMKESSISSTRKNEFLTATFHPEKKIIPSLRQLGSNVSSSRLPSMQTLYKNNPSKFIEKSKNVESKMNLKGFQQTSIQALEKQSSPKNDENMKNENDFQRKTSLNNVVKLKNQSSEIFYPVIRILDEKSNNDLKSGEIQIINEWMPLKSERDFCQMSKNVEIIENKNLVLKDHQKLSFNQIINENRSKNYAKMISSTYNSEDFLESVKNTCYELEEIEKKYNIEEVDRIKLVKNISTIYLKLQNSLKIESSVEKIESSIENSNFSNLLAKMTEIPFSQWTDFIAFELNSESHKNALKLKKDKLKNDNIYFPKKSQAFSTKSQDNFNGVHIFDVNVALEKQKQKLFDEKDSIYFGQKSSKEKKIIPLRLDKINNIQDKKFNQFTAITLPTNIFKTLVPGKSLKISQL